MNLDLIEKHVHLTELPNGVEVMFGGQPCLTVMEVGGGYCWKINPLFAKLTYGANVFEDVPYCYEATDTLAESIASGLTTLHDLGAFYGILDAPEDTFAQGGIEKMTSESVEDLEEAVTHKELLAGAQKAYIDATRQGNGVMARKYGEDILKHKANIAKQMAAAKAKRGLSESLMDDCRKVALKYSDSIMEAHDLAQGLYDSFINEIKADVVTTYDKEKTTNTAHTPAGKKSLFKQIAQSPKEPKFNQWKVKESTEDVSEATLSGDAYWKAKEEAAKEAKAKEERASMGIKEPVKKGRGKPTNIDLEFVHAAAKKNVDAGKRPTAGMERNEKIHFVRHLANHPDFAEKHVSAAGRPTGTTTAAKAEKEKVKKAETSAFSMWAGLGKK